jgi:hypothetical protein
VRAIPDGRAKITLLTVKPANPEAPTVAELNAGIDLNGAIRLERGFSIGGKDLEALTAGQECIKAYDDYAKELGYTDPTRTPLGNYSADLTFEREPEECPCCGEPDYQTWDTFRRPAPGSIIVWDSNRQSVYGHVEIVVRVRYRRGKPLIHNGGRPR